MTAAKYTRSIVRNLRDPATWTSRGTRTRSPRANSCMPCCLCRGEIGASERYIQRGDFRAHEKCIQALQNEKQNEKGTTT